MPIAKLTRPQKPKILAGSYGSNSDANLHDGIDCVNEAQLLRGINPSYAIPRDAINSDLRNDGRPIVHLSGEEFAGASESALYLLGDVTSAIGGGDLTNNGTATFASTTTDDESPLWNNTVATLNGSSQYFSRATEAQFQVGSASFIASAWFNTSTQSTAMKILFYGDEAASEQNYFIGFNSSGAIQCQIDDGTNTVTITDTMPNRFQDGYDHFAAMFVDRTLNIMFLVVDGIIISSSSISAVTATLDNAGTNFQLGAGYNAGVNNYFTGQLANAHVIKSADYNCLAVLATGIRERCGVNGTTPALSASASARFNNLYTFADNDADYVTAAVNLEDGEYDIVEIYEKNTTRGKVELYISDVLIRSAVDWYNGSQTFNNKTTTKRVKLGAGIHRIKMKINGKNASSTDYFAVLQQLIFIKRKGHEQGGTDSFLLLGDELMQIDSDGNTAFAANSTGYYNSLMNRTTGNADDLDYNQGVLFLRGGVWRFDFIYGKDTSCAKIDVYVGVTQIISALDSYAGSASQNNIQSLYARIQQGRNPIKIQANGKNGSSSDYQVNFIAMRGVRVAD